MDIKLKKWKMSDQKRLAQLYNSMDKKSLPDKFPYPYTESDAKAWLSKAIAREGRDGVFRAVKLGGSIVGAVSVERGEGDSNDEAEINYILSPQYRSKGIMTAAVGRACKISFETLNPARITAIVVDENAAAKRVLEKNGFYDAGIGGHVLRGGVSVGLRVYVRQR